MSEDQATYAARQAEIRRQHEKAQEQVAADRALAQEAVRLGLPSPRVRAANAGKLVWRDGPREVETRWVRTNHYVPQLQSHHVLDATCWCGPSERPREADGARTWTHYALMPAERRIEGAGGDIDATAESLADARARGER